jgi:hypothetical protein
VPEMSACADRGRRLVAVLKTGDKGFLYTDRPKTVNTLMSQDEPVQRRERMVKNWTSYQRARRARNFMGFRSVKKRLYFYLFVTYQAFQFFQDILGLRLLASFHLSTDFLPRLAINDEQPL